MSSPVEQEAFEAQGVAMPDRLLIGTVVFDVMRDQQSWLEVEHRTQTRDYYGHCDSQKAAIYLNPDNPEDVTRLSLWHEVLHALAETTMGHPDWANLGENASAREEAVVRAWEHPTLAVLRDNPRLVAYLTEAS